MHTINVGEMCQCAIYCYTSTTRWLALIHGSLLPLNARRYVRYYIYLEIWISWPLLFCPYNLKTPLMQFLSGNKSTSSGQGLSLNKITLQVFFFSITLYIKPQTDFFLFTIWPVSERHFIILNWPWRLVISPLFCWGKNKIAEWVLKARNICL